VRFEREKRQEAENAQAAFSQILIFHLPSNPVV
jgi:hypothetical protein